ncbi:unnamed protein product [Dicrocoelium dendriticum]|nr:unnamed protein product [Dicrocoelium dendriticum]CAH8463342.1 unnamed protein product [Dicrocoelium dendriticum]
MLNQTYPGSASLFQDIGKKMMICLRGGRIYMGFLRIIDQFGNIVIHKAFERIIVKNKFADVPQGILMIRGENITIIGELKEEFNMDDKLERVSAEEIYTLQAEQAAIRKEHVRKRAQLFSERGLKLPELSDLLLLDDS